MYETEWKAITNELFLCPNLLDSNGIWKKIFK